MRPEIESRRGRPASMPTWAMRPGRKKSASERPVPEALRPRPAKLSKTMRERLFQLPMRKAKTPTKRVFFTRRAMMSSSAPQDQKSAASVMSIAISVRAMKATSPPSRPKPLSMYWVKTARKLSMTPVPPMGSLALAGWAIDRRAVGGGVRRRRLRRRLDRRRRRRSGEPKKPAAVLRPGSEAAIVLSPSFAEKLASLQLGLQGIIVEVGARRDGKGAGLLTPVFDVQHRRRDSEHGERHGHNARRGSNRDVRRHQWNIVIVVG